jgi:hypothetical protein
MPSVFHFRLVVLRLFIYIYLYHNIKSSYSLSKWPICQMIIICKYNHIVFQFIFFYFSSRTNWSLANLQKINVHELYTRQRKTLRPWFEFFNTAKFKPPVNIRIGILKIKIYEKNIF